MMHDAPKRKVCDILHGSQEENGALFGKNRRNRHEEDLTEVNEGNEVFIVGRVL
jgi:hypothetical protein